MIAPACWSWPPDLPAPREVDARYRAAAVALGLGSDLFDGLDNRDQDALTDWHAGRCAVCGTVAHLVEDHDHDSGMTRGLLCGSCNTREAFNGGVFDLYRERPPTTLLGLVIRYIDPITRRPDMGRPPSTGRSALAGIGL